MNIKKSIVLRARLGFLVVFLFSIAIVIRMLNIQYVDGEKWRKLAQENVMQYRTVKATRGNIYSDNGSLLATSLPFYKIAMDPSIAEPEIFNKGIDSLAMLLSKYFKDKSAAEYERKIRDARALKKRYIILNRTMVNYQTKKMMSEWPIFREGKHKGGVIFDKVEKRFRPFSYLAMRTIGFVNEDNTGVGLEKSFNDFLAGRDGEALHRRMAGGYWNPIHDDSEIRPKQGVDIQTTIDINLQDVAETSLLNHLAMHNADKGCVILMEVKTGEIKAIANLGRLETGGYTEIYNYAVANEGLTEPGSTFKLASLITLFENSEVQLTDTVETGNGTYEFYDRVMTDSKPGGYGKITVQETFEKSSNIGVSKLINEHFGLKPQLFVDNLYAMHLGERIDFQLKGEAIPYIKKPSDRHWSGVSLPWMSIGYELKLTPIHTLTFYNAVANDGKMIQPIIVKEIKVADKVIERYETKILNEKICSDKTLEKVRTCLEGVVERGTAKNINNAIYKIAGKTGTAQKIVNKQYSKEQYYTSFCGYFPADNPKYSCIVVIDNPKGFNRYGADVAAPIFKEIADKIYSRDLDMHKSTTVPTVAEAGKFPLIQGGYLEDLQLLCNEMSISNHVLEEGDDWVAAQPVNNAVMWKSKGIVKDIMPNVSGMTLRDALYILENMGLNVKFMGSGRVSHQSVAPGTKVLFGTPVFLTIN